MPSAFPTRSDFVDRTCYVCRKEFRTAGFGAKYCSLMCHIFQFAAIDDGCWKWRGVKYRSGYGTFYLCRGEKYFAHRASYEFANGTIPNGLYVLHKCDNPECVKPSHLFLGTSAENTADMIAKGRHRYTPHLGEKNGQAVLTEKQVKQIRKATNSRRELASKYGVSPRTIKAVISRQNWKHVS